MGYTTVVFDLDGTLTDSQAGIIASYQHALGAYDITADAASITAWIGPPLHVGFAALGVPTTEVPDAIDTYRAYFAQTGIYQNRLYDGVTAMLTGLERAGVSLALATSKLTEFAEQIAAQLEIADYFKVVAGANRDGSRTAKKDIVAVALDGLDWPDPTTVALVGDRADDMSAAAHFGLFAVGASWGYGNSEELEASGAQALVAQPAGVIPALLH